MIGKSVKLPYKIGQEVRVKFAKYSFTGHVESYTILREYVKVIVSIHSVETKVGFISHIVCDLSVVFPLHHEG